MNVREAFLATVFFICAGVGVAASGQDEGSSLKFALSGNPDTLDPHKTSGTLTFQAIKSVYDTLVETDDNGEIVPSLAGSWRVSPDALTWTFTLRRDVRFHNGDPLTSADVKATFERIIAEETASPKASEFAAIGGIETPDGYTVILKLTEPSAPLISTLASGWGAILPKALIETNHDFSALPIGTGPYRFVEWVRDNKIAFAKNPGYWMRGYPRMDLLTMHIISERTVQVQALLAGELDIIYNVNQEDVVLLEKDPGIKIDRKLTALVMVMALNTRNSPLDDIRVRQALNYAIDKQRVLDIAYGGGQVVGTFMDYNDPYYEDFTDLYPYDPAKAGSLLAEAGLGDDVVLDMALPQNFEPHVRAGELYQEMLSKVGLRVDLRLVDWSTWISDVYRGGKYDLTVIGHTGKLDPDGRLGGYGTESTYVGWENPETADLIAQGRTTVNTNTRRELYTRALEIMAKEVPFVFTGTSYRYIATRSNIAGFRMDQKLDTFDFRYVDKR